MLPPEVVEEDHRLETAAEGASVELWRHRWHWTTDPTNSQRVSLRVYADAVKRHHTAISQAVKAYELWQEENVEAASTPFTTLDDIRSRASMSESRRVAAETIAKARGTTVRHVKDNRKAELVALTDLVAKTDEADKERKAEQVMGLRLTHERNEAEWQRTSPAYAKWVFISKHLGSARRSLREVLPLVQQLAADDHAMSEVGQFVEGAVVKLREYVDLLQMTITDTLTVDWDAAFEKLQAEEETS